MFRKRRRPSPEFKIPPPFNPIQGGNANLRQDGVSPFCALMQVAGEDIYADYVMCRGFDTRILRFVDYEEGDANKPGIAVAKPYGKRVVGTYQEAEVYPALLPTQGNSDFAGFRETTFVPPSPVGINIRLGQNPGVVTGGLEGGQPENLDETIGSLIDHNGKAVNWLLIDSASPGGGGDQILFRVVDVVCYPELYVTAEWTHYTGGCDSDPPGADPYTGYVDIYDSCVLAYYTVDFLLSGATGRATYWYTRDDCVGKWIVDSICGQPECS